MDTLDLIGTLIALLGAPIIVGSLLRAAPISGKARLLTAAGFALWLAAVAILGAFGVFAPGTGAGSTAISLALMAPLLVFAAVMILSPKLRGVLLALPIPLLLAVHTTRFAGGVFLALYQAERLAAPFAPFAGWGDIVIAATAPAMAWLAYRRRPHWRGAALIWTVLGALDLLISISLGVMSTSDSPFRVFTMPPGSDLMGELPWIAIPVYIVPILLCLHALSACQLLLKHPCAQESRAQASVASA